MVASPIRPARWGILRPLLILAALFVVELIPLTLWLDTATLSPTGVTSLLGRWGAWTLRGMVATAAITAVICFLKRRETLAGLAADASPVAVRWRLLAAHLSLMLATSVLLGLLFHSHPSAAAADWLTIVSLGLGVIATACACLAFLPLAIWRALLEPVVTVWPVLAATGISACLLGTSAESLWNPLSELTFRVVAALLHPVLSSLVVDAAQLTIGTPQFNVSIAPQCSGLEGMGLMLAFGCAWLWLFRSTFRFPRALLLIPVGVAAIWLLNAVRIALLILIGSWGAPKVAEGGFHSQAGWIAFITLALGLALLSQRLPWIARLEEAPGEPGIRGSNPTAAYLAPFLAILAAGMISRAVSGEFEWLYALRFFAAAVVIWKFRAQYRSLNWRFGWLAPLTGVVVIALWIGLEKTAAGTSPLALHLAALPPGVRLLWLSGRVLGAVITVPIAEELAFRGFLMRRIISADFETVDGRRFSWVALLVSSVAFGLLHGDRWLVGTVAGLLYGGVYLRRGRIGDAVVAHASSNALLAVWVLATGNWQLW